MFVEFLGVYFCVCAKFPGVCVTDFRVCVSICVVVAMIEHLNILGEVFEVREVDFVNGSLWVCSVYSDSGL